MDNNEITNEIKIVKMEKVYIEWDKLSKLTDDEIVNLNGRNRLGCDLLDYYFFFNRLETIGNKGINFFNFIENIEYYKSKKYIQTLLDYCDNNNRYKENIYKRYYYIYGLCFGRINGFKITNAMQFYKKYNPSSILDPFCGFGGRLVAALLLNINYIGIDLNYDLEKNYKKLLTDFKDRYTSRVELLFQNSLCLDYENKVYDMVFTSPPYENIEVYKHSTVLTPEQWSAFYKIIFKKLWDNLQIGGIYAININKKIYNNILVPLFGEARETSLLKKSSKNEYTEYIYVWKKEKKEK